MNPPWHEDDADERRTMGEPAPSIYDRWPFLRRQDEGQNDGGEHDG